MTNTTSTTTRSRSLLRRSSVGLGGAAVVLGTALAAAPAQAADTGIPVLEQIKTCESGGDYSAVNASSGASGAYQFLDSTWQSLSASSGYTTAASAPESVQDAAAVELYDAQGTSPWLASQSCWAGASATTESSTGAESTSASASVDASVSASADDSAADPVSSSGSAVTVQDVPAASTAAAAAPVQEAAALPATGSETVQPGQSGGPGQDFQSGGAAPAAEGSGAAAGPGGAC
ncbi:transglycosylase [Kocuria coralli]|uniref:Transglycosylase n=1 Tax=Kocuria coralli TaxID=1461025 RepID=A0A5J5KWK4_9MICC|nr:transglycosylase family protein [Kocuria coralli]KAA9393285.1 transglycosylase [Kocuria coralli]